MQRRGGGKKAAADIWSLGHFRTPLDQFMHVMALVLYLVMQVLSYCRTTFMNSSWKFINISERR